MGSRGLTDAQGQFFVFLPDQRSWWVIVGISGAAFFLDASDAKKLPPSVKCWLGEKPSVVCTVDGDASKVALFLRLADSSWWVRLPPVQDGQLLLFRLPKGRHQLVLTSASVQAFWEGVQTLQPAAQVEVTDGQIAHVTFSVPPTGAIVGEVQDVNGQPINSATVSLERDGVGQMTTVTDRSGRFRLDTIPEGVYRLTVFARDFENWAQPVRVKANETTTVKATLKPQPLGIVKGRIIGKDGQIPKDGRLFVERVLSPMVRQSVAVWAWKPDGRFEGKLIAGTYLLTAQIGGRRAAKQVKVNANQTVDAGDIVLPLPAIVDGIVKSPIPLTNLRVRVVTLDTTDDLTQPQWTSILSDVSVQSDGRFRVEVPPEPVAILVQPFGSGKPLIKRIHAKSGQRVLVQFEFPLFGAIEGQVTRADTGQPVPGAVVTLLDEVGAPVGQTMTNRLGMYRFEPILPGRYSVRCQAQGLAMGFRHNVRIGEGNRVPIDFLLSVGGSLIGKIKANKTPLSRFYVIVDADTNLASTVTPDGQFQVNYITPGRHIVMLFRLGEQVAAKEIVVQSGETVEVVFELP